MACVGLIEKPGRLFGPFCASPAVALAAKPSRHGLLGGTNYSQWNLRENDTKEIGRAVNPSPMPKIVPPKPKRMPPPTPKIIPPTTKSSP
jgi:hypothetical protein